LRIVADLDIFAICFESFENLDLAALKNGPKGVSQDVVFVHMSFISETLVVIALFRTYVLVSHIEKLLKSFAAKCKLIFGLQNSVSPSNVLYQGGESCVHLVFGWAENVEFEVVHLDMGQCRAFVFVGFHNFDAVDLVVDQRLGVFK